jgi:hypothetical protein
LIQQPFRAPPRSLGVTSGDLERALRDCLSRRAALTPPSADRLADAAVRQARVTRRRQAGAGALAVVVFAAVAGVALVRFGPSPEPSGPEFVAVDPPPGDTVATTPPPTEEPSPESATLASSVDRDVMAERSLPVDVVVDGGLVTAGGARIDLGTVGGVAGAYRVGEGWLVLGQGSLWYAVGDTAPRQLLTGVDAVVVAPGGDRVAWREGVRLRLAAVNKGRLIPAGEVAAPDGAEPIAFVGKGVLLARHSGDSVVASYAVWWPGRSGTPPQRWRSSTGVYGTLPDGRTVVAQIPGTTEKQPCLALLDALAGLTVLDRACDLPLTAGAVGWLSPDGRWLVAEGAVDASVLIDVSRAFGDREPAIDAGPGPYGPGAWTDDRTVVHGGPGYLVRLRLDRAAAGRADAVEKIPVRGGDEPVLAVPRLAG